MRISCSLVLSSLLTFSGVAQPPLQSPQEAQAQQSAAKTEPSALKQPLAFGLEDGTPVKLRITRNLSSADAKTGDRADFEVLEDIKVKDTIVIPRGGIAWATVTEAQPKRRMGRGGKLDVNIDDVRLVDGEKVPLRAVKEVKGGGHTGAMTGAMVGTAIVFFPAAPLFLFMHGKDITIPKGTEVTAYINGDIPLEPAKFQTQAASPASATSPAQNVNGGDPALSSVEVKSSPDGAEITVDEKYMGSAPSTLKLTAGDHKIKLEKSGFKIWERTLTVGAGATATINPTLDKE
jgi:PEGA domain